MIFHRPKLKDILHEVQTVDNRRRTAAETASLQSTLLSVDGVHSLSISLAATFETKMSIVDDYSLTILRGLPVRKVPCLE